MSFYAILSDLNKELQTTKNLEGEINYRLLKAQVSQQCLKILDKNITSYVRSIKDYFKNKEKYKGQPKFPKYICEKENKSSLLFFA